jgi:DNA polymerase III epsilon subunit-like protein
MFYCIDFESNGAANGQEPLEFAWVQISLTGDILDSHEIGFTEVKGGRKLDFKQTVPHLRDTWPTIKKNLQGAILCGHNVNYDHSLLIKTFPLLQTNGLVDTLTIYRQLYGVQIIDYSLSNLINVFQLGQELESFKCNEHFEPHRALYDAFACALLLQRLLKDETTSGLFTGKQQGKLF